MGVSVLAVTCLTVLRTASRSRRPVRLSGLHGTPCTHAPKRTNTHTHLNAMLALGRDKTLAFPSLPGHAGQTRTDGCRRTLAQRGACVLKAGRASRVAHGGLSRFMLCLVPGHVFLYQSSVASGRGLSTVEQIHHHLDGLSGGFGRPRVELPSPPPPKVLGLPGRA